MQINCISCGHKIDVGKSYDDFEGQIKCNICGAILEIRTEEGVVKMVRMAQVGRQRVSSEEAYL